MSIRGTSADSPGPGHVIAGRGPDPRGGTGSGGGSSTTIAVDSPVTDGAGVGSGGGRAVGAGMGDGMRGTCFEMPVWGDVSRLTVLKTHTSDPFTFILSSSSMHCLTFINVVPCCHVIKCNCTPFTVR